MPELDKDKKECVENQQSYNFYQFKTHKNDKLLKCYE